MLGNRTLAKAIADAGWAELLRQLQYKAQWYGRTLVGVDRWFPSSKRCSGCGHTVSKMPLSVREWTCPGCGLHHDRDENAARNVLAAGLAASAHGEAASPAGIAMPVGSVP
jgi:putative transposase